MTKKLICLGVMLVMIFSLVACNNFNLTEYKENAITALEAYAIDKGQENYSEANWTVIQGLVTNGKVAINAAESKTAVDTAVETAKTEIDEVEFELTEELLNRIKADYLQQFGYELYFGDEFLNKFYGLYNGAAVFFIAGDDAVLKTVTISGLEFSYNYGWIILVWKNGVFYDLEDIEVIFEAGILTQANLVTIAAIHAEANASEVSIEEDLELTEELLNRIKADYLRDLHANGETNLTLDDVEILRNYGVYGEAVVVKMNRGAYLVATQLTIAEVDFYFEDSNTPLVWVKGQFYELVEAYEQGLLSKADLTEISRIQNDFLGL